MATNPSHRNVLIRGGRIIDPACGRDEIGDLAIVDGCIAEKPAGAAVHVVDATGLIVCPGLWDIHVHLREPGQEHKEDIASGTAAAAAGGFTTVACMPNTTPTLDTPDAIKKVIDTATRVGLCNVLPIAAITKNRVGRELTDFVALKAAGAVAFSNDGDGVEDDDVMLCALQKAKEVDAVIIQHCEFKSMSAGGVMHAGATAKKLGLPGIDPRAEEAMIERDLDLVRKTGARYHVAHISTGRAIQMIRSAKAGGLPVTTEVCAHHLLLTDEDCTDADPNFKMHPPLRSEADVQACREGLADGTIDCLVTDHAPHSAAEKAVGFLRAPFGIIGLETSLGLVAEALVKKSRLGWPALLSLMSRNPCCTLGIPFLGFETGTIANVTLIDPEAESTIDPGSFRSKSKNTPFAGLRLSTRVVGTWFQVTPSYENPHYQARNIGS